MDPQSGVYPMREKHGDIIAGLATVVFAAFILYESMTLPRAAALYPRLVGGIIGCAGILLLLKALARREAGHPIVEGIAWGALVTAVVIWLLAVFGLNVLGFYSSLAVMLLLLSWVFLGMPRNVRSIAGTAAFSLGVTVVLWLVFRHGFGLSTPRGLLM